MVVRSAPKEPKQQAKNQANEQAGGNGKVKTHVLSLDDDILDEPTGALDTKSSENVHDILCDSHIASGAASLSSPHDPAFARGADRQIEIVDGRIVH
ncbi:MAG: hypothetical protein ACREYE_24325 [Gammaproteobacteria bacterium]